MCQELKLKDKECERLSQVRNQLEQELEELTASLFEVGNIDQPLCLFMEQFDTADMTDKTLRMFHFSTNNVKWRQRQLIFD